ncbi:MAG: protein phosphatase 2C domain-containing protein [Myxococcales bacterium]|nr:protein phosphatase 2C domain-containing protein [Myxococcales bacterium]
MNTITTVPDEAVPSRIARAPEAAVGGDLEIAAGSVAGWVHRRIGRPNQDAARVLRTAGGVAIAVCDGCGSGSRSEIGATIGARLWTQIVAERLRDGGPIAAGDFQAMAATVLDRLAVVAAAMGGDLAEVTREHLLFTSLVAAITDDQVAVAALGDGVVALGDVVHVLGPFEDNAPPYLTEAWFGPPRTLATWVRGRAEIDRLVLATDGAVPLVAPRDGRAAAPTLDELAGIEAIYKNPFALERRLRLLADDGLEIDWEAHRTSRRAAYLDDDTTAVIVRWSRA